MTDSAMPNAQCNKCGKFLDDIIVNEATREEFKKLVEARASRLLGMITNIKPGIRHCEVNKCQGCDGFLWFKPFHSTPKGVNW